MSAIFLAILLVVPCVTEAHALTVHCPPDPSGPLKTAADELERLGPSIPVLAQAEVFLGSLPPDDHRFERPTEPLSDDAYFIQCAGNAIVILGETDRALLFGTYDLLERLGVTWYAPGREMIAPVPKLVPFRVVEKPAFKRRGLVILWSPWAEKELVQWAARNRLNTVAFITGLESLDELLARVCAASQWAADHGITLEIETHAMSHLLPRNLFADHPDYFRADGRGVRHSDHNLCVSNADALAVVAANTRDLLRRFPPGTERLFLWQDDLAQWCYCDQCRAMPSRDQALYAANALAKAARQELPKARMGYLAYRETMRPPKKVRPHRNLFLEYAPIGRCWAHALDDPACERNAQHADLLHGLLDCFGKKDSQALEYWLDVSLWSRWAQPFVRQPEIPEAMQADLLAYRNEGIQNVTTFCVGFDGAYFDRFRSFTTFAYPKLLWDPNAALTSLRARFCEASSLDAATQHQLEHFSTRVLEADLHHAPVPELPSANPDAQGLRELAARRLQRPVAAN